MNPENTKPANKPPPLPSIGAGGGGGGQKPLPKKPSISSDKIEKASSTTSSKNSAAAETTGKNKTTNGDWNRYFAFINDKEREKLMQLPELEKSKKKKKKKTGGIGLPKTNQPIARSKSAKTTIERSKHDELNGRVRSESTGSNSSESEGGRKESTPKSDEKQSNANDTPDSEKVEKNKNKKKKSTSSTLGNFNFNSDLDRKNSKQQKLPVYNNGFVYYRSHSTQRTECRPQIDPTSDYYLVDDFHNSLRFRTSQNNLLRSMRANL
jgi:hypothetical protein